MKTVKGDLIKMAMNGDFDVIVHGCNCFHTMGSGIAGQLVRKFPKVLGADQVGSVYGDWNKLGDYTWATIGEFTVVNAYTQFTYNPKVNPVEYSAIRDVFRRIKEDFAGERIGYPLIGCGLAGGDWKIVSKIIEAELEGEDHTLVMYDSK